MKPKSRLRHLFTMQIPVTLFYIFAVTIAVMLILFVCLIYKMWALLPEEVRTAAVASDPQVPASSSVWQPPKDDLRIPNFIPLHQTEAQEKADAAATQNPESEITKSFVNGDWEDGVAGLKTLIADIHARAGDKDMPARAELAKPIGAYDAKGSSIVWKVECRTGPYSLKRIEIAEYDGVTIVTAIHAYEFSKSQGEKWHPMWNIQLHMYEIALRKQNGKLSFETAELRTQNCRTDEPAPEALDQKSATECLSRTIRFIEEHCRKSQ